MQNSPGVSHRQLLVQSVIALDSVEKRASPSDSGADLGKQKEEEVDDATLSSEVLKKAPVAALQRGQSKLHLTKMPFSSGSAWRSSTQPHKPE